MMRPGLKYSLFAAVLFLLPVTLPAADDVTVTADPFPAERPGQYVFYHDMRIGVYGSTEPLNRLMGILKIDEKKYVIRIYYPADGRNFYYTGRYVLSRGMMEFTPENIQGDEKEGTVILADVLNLVNYLGAETVKHGRRLKSRETFSVDSEWAGYGRKFVNEYKWWVPFYKLTSMTGTDTGKTNGPDLKLLCIGSVYDNDATSFTSVSRLPVLFTKKTGQDRYVIKPAEKMQVILGGITFNLDKNWNYQKPDPASGMPHETYWMKKFTVRDAQIGVESVDTTSIHIDANEIDSFAATLQYQTCVITDAVNIDEVRKELTLCLWDPVSGSCTIMKYRSLGIKNKVLLLLNFSAFDFVYYSNREYFDAILDVKGR